MNSDATNLSPKRSTIPRLQEEIFAFHPGDDIATVIDRGVVVNGGIQIGSSKGLLVSGVIQGDVVTQGAVFVAQDGQIHGAVTAAKLIVDGTVVATEGKDITVSGMLGLSSRAKLNAMRIHYGDIEMGRGCKIVGELIPLSNQDDQPGASE